MGVNRRSRRRAFTLVEMLVAMAVMGIVMSFAALEFRAVVFSYLNIDSHLSAEQQARVAIAKVNDLSRQASVVNDVQLSQSPQPAVLQPVSTPGPVLQFTRADSLQNIPLFDGAPDPCYDIVTITLAQVNGSIQIHNLVAETSEWDPSRSDCTKPANPVQVIARNVQDFTVQHAERCPRKDKCSYLQGYRIDVSIFDYDDHAADQHAGALYHLSSVITPLTFGASE
jgi:prepilin-type N-terminal cleavage/methylation domain-containing protein